MCKKRTFDITFMPESPLGALIWPKGSELALKKALGSELAPYLLRKSLLVSKLGWGLWEGGVSENAVKK